MTGDENHTPGLGKHRQPSHAPLLATAFDPNAERRVLSLLPGVFAVVRVARQGGETIFTLTREIGKPATSRGPATPRMAAGGGLSGEP